MGYCTLCVNSSGVTSLTNNYQTRTQNRLPITAANTRQDQNESSSVCVLEFFHVHLLVFRSKLNRTYFHIRQPKKREEKLLAIV